MTLIQPARLIAPARMALLLLALTACMPARDAALQDDPMPTTGTGDGGVMLHLLTIERAYTLEDPRDFEFSQQIADQAAAYCGRAGHTVQSTRPYGPERVGAEFLYRMVEVGISCNG